MRRGESSAKKKRRGQQLQMNVGSGEDFLKRSDTQESLETEGIRQ